MERGMRPWYFASFVHRIWMNLRLFTVISLRDQGDRSKGEKREGRIMGDKFK